MAKKNKNGLRTKTKPGYKIVGYCPTCGLMTGAPGGAKAAKLICKNGHIFTVKGSI